MCTNICSVMLKLIYLVIYFSDVTALLSSEIEYRVLTMATCVSINMVHACSFPSYTDLQLPKNIARVIFMTEYFPLFITIRV